MREDHEDLKGIGPRLKQWEINIPKYKYDEDKLLQELKNYIDNTYNSHYVGDDNIQSMDLIGAKDHAFGFCIGNIIKYSTRYGNKKGQERQDILKILHYALFLLHFHDKKMAKTIELDNKL